MWPVLRTVLLVAMMAAIAGCSSVYYSALEKVGIEKREILVDRLESARDAQGAAQEQFQDALEQLASMVGFDGGDLEAMYSSVSAEYEQSQAQAEAVRERVAAVKDVANALFEEWEDELDEYSNPRLQRESRRQLDDTRDRFNQLAVTMDRAVSSMEPVLTILHDQVLFLKHDLNARALGSLSATVEELEADVQRLVEQMQSAIAEADRFIATMKTE